MNNYSKCLKYESETRKYCLNLTQNDINISNRIENIFFNYLNKSFFFHYFF